ncbi:exopolygalacturonase [Populus alba x Populus x berolinensis]|uniref:Exopolygalacturonase n=1 Tax=Populus alba x Populus x berolinensis TaxID=444605 RepID=A0AAD6WDF2_9ROSI|nr:exopolygalacturonase [Populus alba x Populus x berolinensis]
MTIAGSILVLGLALLSCVADGAPRHHIGLSHRRSLVDGSGAAVTVFDVTKHGAKADDKTDNAETWRAACDSGVPAKMVIPGGTFVTSPVVFQGPCKSTEPIVFEVQGNVKATTDLSEYSSEQWILFEIIDGLTLNGGGTFDGQGSAVWKYNDCHENKQCQPLPSSIKLSKVKNAFVHEISSVDSKYFHMHVTSCHSISIHNINLTAPANSPNTDGIHISHSDGVHVTSSKIGTGDDCVSIGQGSTNILISQVFCGPGHGLSVGSLGKYKNEEDVSGIVVTNCTLFNTTNGVRIKSYAASDPSQAFNITFKDITMDSVKNPIIIDQKYGSRNAAVIHRQKPYHIMYTLATPSRVKISNVHYQNIKGTSTSNVAVSFLCSSSVPCQGVELVDIDLAYIGQKANMPLSSSCLNANVKSGGKQNPGCN